MSISPSTGWQFPLPRTHTGLLLGNGTFGVMVWGEANVLRVTVNRADFWDRRGGVPWEEGMSYEAIKNLLEAGNEKGLRELFEGRPQPPGDPKSPSLLPFGRIELIFPTNCTLTTGEVRYESGQVAVRLKQDSAEHEVTFDLDMARPLLHISLPAELPRPIIQLVSAWDYVGEYLRSIGFAPPQFCEDDGLAGWLQMRPADEPLCLGYRINGNSVWLALEYGNSVPDAVGAVLNAAVGAGAATLRGRNDEWWRNYWDAVPRLSLPDEQLEFLYRYGMYKFAGLTNPAGIAAGLQGAWIEEYQMPPWSGDYHFNINVQMCYWPAYRANLLTHLHPLFALLKRWLPQLRHNANIFCGIDDGLMLPHAVDDRCTNVGGFWTGSIDHGCTAWVAEMMYRYYQYTGDVGFLRGTAYPFMRGALRVYEAMLEREGDTWSLPVSVSPEYRGAQMNAWGRNASFQLACIHWLCRALQEAAKVLGEPAEPVWQSIREGLPLAALYAPPGQPEAQQIALWEGTPLEESHRHHSHLAGIYPFVTLDLDDPDWYMTYVHSINNWIAKGMGLWSGWCISWASMLHARCGNPEMAVLLLHIWQQVFTNEGHGTLHDCNFQGFTLMGIPWPPGSREPQPEIMQMDAGMGVTTAIMELLLHTRQGVNYLFAGAPDSWRELGFQRLRTEGGFQISATRTAGLVDEVQVHATIAGVCRLANPWMGPATIKRADSVAELNGKVIEINLAAGETVSLLPPRS